MNILNLTIETRFHLFFKKFTNLLMIDGKKNKASKILFKTLLILKKRLKKDLEKRNQMNSENLTKTSDDKNETFLTKPHHYHKDSVMTKTKSLSNRSVSSSSLDTSHDKNKPFSEKEFSINSTLLHFISQTIDNITPNLEVRKVRVGGSTYIVPTVLSKKKQETLALKWLIESAKKRQKNSNLDFSLCLADELLDASRKVGQTRQKRDELHRLAQMNRAYIRYRWW